MRGVPLLVTATFRLPTRVPGAPPADCEQAIAKTLGGRTITRKEFEDSFVKTFGDLPLIVLSRGLDQKPDWQAMQVELLQLSSNSQQLIADKSDHNIEIGQPEAAAEAIMKMVEQLR